MLDDFQNKKFYQYAINLKKYYHAYIFEVDDVEKEYPFILAFAKMIICKNHYTNKDKCLECNICNLIDKGNYEDFKLIEPDGLFIKKEQILELEKIFSLTSRNNTNQVYIIKYADKMNSSAFNSLLKFIEEPEKGIYGFLITDNKKKILPTIISRCISINLREKSNFEYSEIDINTIISFLNLVFEKKEDSLPYIKSSFLNFYKTKDEIINAFNLMEIILESKINSSLENTSINKSLYDIINNNISNVSFDDILFYLEIIIKYKNKLLTVVNLNLNLFMDCFVIEMSKVVNL